MPPFLTKVWVVSLLLAKGSCLICEVCTNLMANSCSGVMQTCSSQEDVCIATLKESALGDEKTVEFEKACGKASECGQPTSMSAGNFRVTSISRCCSLDHCNSGSIEWQPMNNTANGKKCPSCLAQKSQDCGKSKTINCTGDETHCIQLTAVQHRGSQVTLQGCATNSMSESKGKAAFPASSVVVKDFSYIDNKGSQAMLHPALLTLTALNTFLHLHLFCVNPS